MSFLETLFGVNPATLDERTRQYAEKLGEGGVRKLVGENRGKRLYRGERITDKEALQKRQQIERLRETGASWAPGEPSIGGDRPEDWYDNEEEYLADR